MSCDKKTQLHYLLALLNTTNLIFRLGSRIFELFPDIEELFHLSTADLLKLGISSTDASKLKNPNWDLVDQDLDWASEANNHIITIKESQYPQLLKEISDPPVILFATGDLQLLKSDQLAIVGSRNPTPGGLETAFDFSNKLAQMGLTITSGFASGIDAASHRGAIAATGKTIAVMGTGLNKLYPAYHKELAQKIINAGGLLISEFPLMAKGKVWHFPMRNRIISGLAVGTLVVEATIRSGSLITARLAGEQGRDLFAIPGSINNPQARGCHHLICQGAKLVQQPEDVSEELKIVSKKSQPQDLKHKNCKNKNKLDRAHKKLLDCLGYETATLDDLILRTKLSVQEVSTILLELELQGFIKEVTSGYIRI